MSQLSPSTLLMWLCTLLFLSATYLTGVLLRAESDYRVALIMASEGRLAVETHFRLAAEERSEHLERLNR